MIQTSFTLREFKQQSLSVPVPHQEEVETRLPQDFLGIST